LQIKMIPKRQLNF